MPEVFKGPMEEFLKNFKVKEKIEKDPFFYRNKKIGKTECRHLHAFEVEILVKNNNFAENWNEILVTDEFDPKLVKNCEFYGRITIGKLQKNFLDKNDLRLPVGLSNSTIISCDIGDNVVIRNVSYLSHYIIGNNCILFNIGEMVTTFNARFGNGIVKEGDDESTRIWLEICNENQGRKILPFDNLITADAYIWSKFRDDKKLMKKLIDITESAYDKKGGYYGKIGACTVIKNCRIIKNVNIGEHAYVKGANKLKNLTIHSSLEEQTQIGEGVELVNGIIGFASKIFYGSKAVRFVTGRNTQLKYGARLLNSVLGDNSTVSCCEILNNLIFPFHEQHHNNSFLIASTVMGQANIAAGATIGSNHNSRSPDGEIIAGRGFWPGLCTNFKHNSKFASFTLIAKGNYQYELNITYPFSLISTDGNELPIKIIPAYWFTYNMFAIARNNFKFKERDKRVIKIQNIETDFLAPDSISEILYAIKKLYLLIGEKISSNKNIGEDELIKIGKNYCATQKEEIELFDKDVMNKLGGLIIKPIRAIKEYITMCKYFTFRSLIEYLGIKEGKSSIDLNNFIESVQNIKKNKLYTKWINVGGQLMPEEELLIITKKIKDGLLKNWDEVHKAYDFLWDKYNLQKTRFSIYALEEILEKKIENLTISNWKELIKEVIDINEKIYERSYSSRLKDYESSFRKMTYNNKKEMLSVLGDIKDNTFLQELKKETERFSSIYKTILLSVKN